MSYKANSICAHTVAAAEANNDLASFLAWYTKAQGKKPVNLFQAAKHGMPAGAGRKGDKPKRLRPKKVNAIVDTVPLISSQSPAASCNIPSANTRTGTENLPVQAGTSTSYSDSHLPLTHICL